MKNQSLEVFNDTWIPEQHPSIEERREIQYDRLAAMGSCFARNLNRWLNFHGLSEREMPWDILYNPFSVQGELQRIYEPETKEHVDAHALKGISSNGTTRYQDPWRSWDSHTSLDDLNKSNESYDIKVRKFLNASNGMLITLGLTEVWQSSEDNSPILNNVPISSLRLNDAKWISRFASVSEVSDSLDQTIHTIRKNITNDGPIIFTLSPVPLKFTASNRSVREANNISKSTLAVALGELVLRDPSVEYFPSYEIVQALSERDAANTWQEDGRHVTAYVVDQVAREFVKSHKGPVVLPNNRFWVPRVGRNGKINGRLFVDGEQE